jgi:lipopolysaccharide assembly protein A
MTVHRFLRWLIWLPLLIVMIAFALSNRQPVDLGLFPTGLSIPLPLSLAVLGAMAIGFFLGGLFTWIPALRYRRAARRAREALRVLEAKHEELKAQRSGPSLPPSH